MSGSESTLFVFLAGVVPAFIWLLFWLREDAKRPEPKGRIIQTFLVGMVAVVIVLPFQKAIAGNVSGMGFWLFSMLAVSEELVKFVGAYVVALRSRDDDEPIDPLIYMITAALGFAALENALFLWNPFQFENGLSIALTTSGTRFLGASLLHVIASGAIGVSLALSFYKSRVVKILSGLLGLLIAVGIHTAFNLSIISQPVGSSILTIFAAVWVGVVCLLLIFEKVKRIAP